MNDDQEKPMSMDESVDVMVRMTTLKGVALGFHGPTDRVLKAIIAERSRQMMKWGWSRGRDTIETDPLGYVHDDAHSPNDWIAMSTRLLGAAQESVERGDRFQYENNLVQAATLIVAAIEAKHRADR